MRGREAALKAFGRAVRRRRHALGLSLEGLAERSGLHWTYVGGIERGQRNLGLVNLLRLAEGLDVHPATLLRQAYPSR